MVEENSVEGDKVITSLEGLVIESLTESFASHNKLGPEGKERIVKNQFGDTALRADYEAEEVIIARLRKSGIPMRIVSEEHGVIDLGSDPEYLAIIDGIDGTSGYERESGRYGTMFAILKGTDPRYSDYLVSAILEYPSGRLFVASKGRGAVVIEDGQKLPIRTSGSSQLDLQHSRIYVDGGFRGATKPFKVALANFHQCYIGYAGDPPSWGPDCIFFADLAKGERDIFLLFTGKHNLEMAVAFGLLKEAGGDIVDYQEGLSIGEKKYFEFERIKHLPVVAGATRELAQQFIHYLATQRLLQAKVQDYFFKLGLEMRSALRLHQAAGLWERVDGKRDWGNVSEHCLVEAARSEVLAGWLGFDENKKKELVTAAALHDFSKKLEKEITKAGGGTDESFDKAEREALRMLKDAGFGDRIIYIVSGAGTVDSVEITIPQILTKGELSDDDIAYLVLHYIDDYTIGNGWVKPAESLPNGGMINAFDRRMDDLEVRYPELKQQGFIDKQREVGTQVEERLAGLISERTGQKIDPKLLPELIDQKIRERILNTAPAS